MSSRGQHRSGRRRNPPRGGRPADADGEGTRLRRSQLRFALTFVVAAGAMFSLYAFPYAEHGAAERWFQSYLRGYAHLAGGILSLFDRHVRVTDNVIAGRFTLGIVKTCDAMEANVLFLAAIVAFPAAWKRKLTAAAVGLCILIAVNVTRICSLYFVGVYAPSAFDTIHIELWPLLLIVIATAEFAGWAIWMARTPAGPAPPAVAEGA